MIRSFINDGNRLVEIDNGLDRASDVIWYDLFEPTDSEEAALENRLGIDIPTREEMDEIEISSRLYNENDTTFMTAILPANSADVQIDMQPVTFVLSKTHLVTIRYHDPRAFQTFPGALRRGYWSAVLPRRFSLHFLRRSLTGLQISWKSGGVPLTKYPTRFFAGTPTGKTAMPVCKTPLKPLAARAT